jgi:hypothetical protein
MASQPNESAPVSNDFVDPQRAAAPKRGGGIGVVIQFVVGLLVIAGVAAAVVWLWVKYYQ